jgi:hypothetical protein
MVTNADACQRMYAAMMTACYAMSFNPPAFVACAAAASTAFAVCLAAN